MQKHELRVEKASNALPNVVTVEFQGGWVDTVSMEKQTQPPNNSQPSVNPPYSQISFGGQTRHYAVSNASVNTGLFQFPVNTLNNSNPFYSSFGGSMPNQYPSHYSARGRGKGW